MIIIYRACSQGNPSKNRPITPKVELVRRCFGSFLKAFDGVECEVRILLDKPTNEFREIFKGFKVEESYYADFNEGNIRSFHRQLDIACESDHPDFLLIEDDYYFLPHAGKVIEGNALSFYTPYDHPRHYDEDGHMNERQLITVDNNWHWRTIKSTTLTFGGKTDFLRDEVATMKKYGWADHPMWVDVTQRVALWSPIPSLATHMEVEHLSFCIDWDFNL